MPACMSVGELSSSLSLCMHASLSVSRPTVRLSARLSVSLPVSVCLSVSVCLFIGLLFSNSLIDLSFVRLAVSLCGCLIVYLAFLYAKQNVIFSLK